MDQQDRQINNSARFKSVDGFLRPVHPTNLTKLHQPAKLQASDLKPTSSINGHNGPHHAHNPAQPPTAPRLNSHTDIGPRPNIPRRPSMLNQNLASSNVRSKQPKAKLPLWRKTAAGFAAIILITIVLAGGWVGWKFAHNLSKVFGGSITSNIGQLFSSTPLKGEDQGRVNILLAGNSSDDPGHSGADLTDSIMIVSIDTKNHTAIMLSVPRDLWVNIPGFGHTKINAAILAKNFNQPGLPHGGMGQLEQVIETDLGIPINYYALTNFTAFRDAVDAVGGIQINIQSSDPRGIYDQFTNVKLSNGIQTLNGDLALRLARARGDGTAGDVSYGFPSSDFDRTSHQRQMLVALVQKATSIGVLSNPVRIGQLFDALGNNIQTDFNLSNALRLVQLIKGMGSNNIQSLSYSETGTNPLIGGYTSSDGQESLIPKAGIDNWTAIKRYYLQLTSSNPVIKEAAKLEVLNGTGITGLAKDNQNSLTAKGYNVVGSGDASKPYNTTTVIDCSNGQKNGTLSSFKSVYGSSIQTTTQPLEKCAPGVDIIVVIGLDQKNSAASTSSTSSTSTTGQ